MINRKWVLAIMPVVLLGMTVVSPAQVAPDWDDTYFQGLDLSEKQWDQIRELRLKLDKQIIPLESKLRTAYMELDDLEMRGAAAQNIEKKMAELDSLELEVDELYMKHEDQIRALLTDEQRARYDRGAGLDLGLAPGLGYGYGQGYGRGLARGWGAPGYMGRGYGRGYYGRGYYGRGYGRAYDRGYGRAYDRGYGRAYDRGYGRGYYGSAYGPGYLGRGYGRGYGRGNGRGYYCPYNYRGRRNGPLGFWWRR